MASRTRKELTPEEVEAKRVNDEALAGRGTGFSGKGGVYNPVPGSPAFERGVNRIVRLGDLSVEHGVAEQGVDWYHDVRRAIVSGIPDIRAASRQLTGARRSDLDVFSGAGIVSAASPNMDFDAYNIHALSDLRNLRPEHWDVIRASANQPGVEGTNAQGKRIVSRAKRTDEARDVLSQFAPNLSHAGDHSLMKVHAILTGQNPVDVLDRSTGPKTNSFFWNLADPSHSMHDFVTIDGRQADMIANRMRPWDMGRGIESALRDDGKLTRYEMHDAVMSEATRRLAARHSVFQNATKSGVQGATWLMGKEIERMPPTATGDPRGVGVGREGQQYILGNGRPNRSLPS